MILDERLARRHAMRLGLTVTGVLGVLLRAKDAGLVDVIRPLLEQMQDGGIHLGADLAARTLVLAGETGR